jgi:hypothetical protein
MIYNRSISGFPVLAPQREQDFFLRKQGTRDALPAFEDYCW